METQDISTIVNKIAQDSRLNGVLIEHSDQDTKQLMNKVISHQYLIKLVNPIIDLAGITSNLDKKIIEFATAYSLIQHNGQERKTGGPFFRHPYGVALLSSLFGWDSKVIALSYIHDCPEEIAALIASNKDNLQFSLEDPSLINILPRKLNMADKDKNLLQDMLCKRASRHMSLLIPELNQVYLKSFTKSLKKISKLDMTHYFEYLDSIRTPESLAIKIHDGIMNGLDLGAYNFSTEYTEKKYAPKYPALKILRSEYPELFGTVIRALGEKEMDPRKQVVVLYKLLFNVHYSHKHLVEIINEEELSDVPTNNDSIIQLIKGYDVLVKTGIAQFQILSDYYAKQIGRRNTISNILHLENYINTPEFKTVTTRQNEDSSPFRGTIMRYAITISPDEENGNGRNNIDKIKVPFDPVNLHRDVIIAKAILENTYSIKNDNCIKSMKHQILAIEPVERLSYRTYMNRRDHLISA